MIEVTQNGPLWTITLNRPEKANALTRPMLVQLAEAAEAAELARAKAMILTGRGKVFSAGADLEEARLGLAQDLVWERVSRAVANFSGLSIAALNGTLAGGAMGMALACDLRIAVPGANFFYPVMRLGYLPQPGDPQRLVSLIGPSRAKMILLGGAKIDAEEALAWGLIDRIASSDALPSLADDLTREALGASYAHVAGIKRMIQV